MISAQDSPYVPSLSSSFLLNQIQRRFLNSIHILIPNSSVQFTSSSSIPQFNSHSLPHYWHQAIPDYGRFPIPFRGYFTRPGQKHNAIHPVLSSWAYECAFNQFPHSSRSLFLGLWMTFIPYLSGMNDLGLFLTWRSHCPSQRGPIPVKCPKK